MRTKSQITAQAQNTILPSGVIVASHTQRTNRSSRGRQGLRRQLMAVAIVVFCGVAPAMLGASEARADFKKQPIQELLDTDTPVYDIPRDRDYTIDQQPQYADPDTEALMDANDAEYTTPLMAFLFWLVLGALVIGSLIYAFLRTGAAKPTA